MNKSARNKTGWLESVIHNRNSFKKNYLHDDGSEISIDEIITRPREKKMSPKMHLPMNQVLDYSNDDICESRDEHPTDKKLRRSRTRKTAPMKHLSKTRHNEGWHSKAVTDSAHVNSEKERNHFKDKFSARRRTGNVPPAASLPVLNSSNDTIDNCTKEPSIDGIDPPSIDKTNPQSRIRTRKRLPSGGLDSTQNNFNDNAVKTKDMVISKLQKTNMALTSTAMDQSQRITALENAKRSVELKLQEKMARISELEDDLRRIEKSQSSQLKNKVIEKKSSDIKEIYKITTDFQSESSESRNRIKELQTKDDVSKEKILSLESIIKQMEKMNKGYEEEDTALIQSLQDELSQVTKEKEKLKTEVDNELKEKNSRIAKLQEAIDNCSVEAVEGKYMSEIKALKISHAKTTNELFDSIKKGQQYEIDQNTVDSLRRDISSLSSKNLEMETKHSKFVELSQQAKLIEEQQSKKIECLEREKRELIDNAGVERADLKFRLERNKVISEEDKKRIKELESNLKISEEKICSLKNSIINLEKVSKDLGFLQDSLSLLEKKNREERVKYEETISDYEKRLKEITQELVYQKDSVSKERSEMKKDEKSKAKLFETEKKSLSAKYAKEREKYEEQALNNKEQIRKLTEELTELKSASRRMCFG